MTSKINFQKAIAVWLGKSKPFFLLVAISKSFCNFAFGI